jgi:hypothetical protein
MGLAQRTARTWAAGERRPEKPREVARLLVALAREAALGFSADEHLRAEEIRGELPERVAAVQCFASIMNAALAERCGGVRALARAMAGEGDADLEPTVCRWLTLAGNESRLIRGKPNSRLPREVQLFRNQEDASAHPHGTRPGRCGELRCRL